MRSRISKEFFLNKSSLLFLERKGLAGGYLRLASCVAAKHLPRCSLCTLGRLWGCYGI